MSERHISPPANGGVAQPAAAEIFRKHVEAGGTTVLTLGSLTTLHKFQVAYPGSFAKIETLYSMFGAVDVEGNVFHSVSGFQTSEPSHHSAVRTHPSAHPALAPRALSTVAQRVEG